MSDLLALRDQFHSILTTYCQENRSPPDYAAWVAELHARLLAAINAERTQRHKPAITLDTLERTEQLALGHTDYATKFPFYCAELVLDQLGPPP